MNLEQLKAERERIAALLEGITEDVELVDLTEAHDGIVGEIKAIGTAPESTLYKSVAQPADYEDGSDPLYKGMAHWLTLARAQLASLEREIKLWELVEKWEKMSRFMPNDAGGASDIAAGVFKGSADELRQILEAEQ